MIDESALLASFVEESQQHLQTIEPDLLELEKSGDSVDSELLNRVFRSIHSIKGASGFFGLRKIGELSHVMESLLSLLRDRKLSVTRELTDALLAGVDLLRAMVDDVGGSERFEIGEQVAVLQALLDSRKVDAEDVEKRKVTVCPAREFPRVDQIPEQPFRRKNA